jgi:hypothetical protein
MKHEHRTRDRNAVFCDSELWQEPCRDVEAIIIKGEVFVQLILEYTRSRVYIFAYFIYRYIRVVNKYGRFVSQSEITIHFTKKTFWA